MAERYPNPDLLIEPDTLQRRLDSPRRRLIDLRPAAAYEEGHLPGAVRLDESLLRNVRDPESYLPPAEEFAQAMRAAGVGRGTDVVAYDDQGGRSAARLWYCLNVFGHRRVRLLHGGAKRWVREGRPLTREIAAPAAGDFESRRPGTFSCPSSEVLARRPGVVLLDARSPEEYRGEGNSRGHLPGAVLVDWRENLDAEGINFKSARELQKLYRERGVTPDKEIVTYCASGGRASLSLFALTLLGYRKVRLYYGSYTDYVARPGALFER